MRHSYTTDPSLIDRVFPLLGTAFRGISAHARRIILPGSRWEENSTPFLTEEAGQPIAHIGLLPIPMTIAGRPTLIGGLHAVCTHPAHRRRGHFHHLMHEALAYCDQHFQTLILFTSQPHLYTPFGFRPVQEHHFTAEIHSPAGHRAGPAFRPLDPSNPADLHLLDHHLTHRAPVSQLLGITNEKAIFSFHCPTQGLLYSEALATILLSSLEGTTLTLTDIIAPRLPSLSAILTHLPHQIDRITFRFSPDQFDVTATPIPNSPDLMVRGPFPPEGHPFMVPPPARC